MCVANAFISSNIFNVFIDPVCMSVLPACTHVHCVQVWCPQRPEEGTRSPGTGVTDGCDLPYGCWEPISGPLKEQPVLLIAELPSLQT